MVGRDGHVKITDFGIARMASAAVRTQTGMVLGSPKYMSPEQVMGKLTDQRSDIFSLGVMLYEMLTGQAPFSGENVNAIMYQTLNSVPPSPSTLNLSVPDMLNFVVAKALAKNVDDRYQNAKDLANDLRACKDTLPKVSASVEYIKPKPASLTDSSTSLSRFDDSQELKPILTSGLSTSFDSIGATMRLAALTSSSQEVEELTKTLKMTRPSLDELNRSAAQQPNIFGNSGTTSSVVARASGVPPIVNVRRREGGPSLLLIEIIVLILLGLILVLVY
jgi:serine/threonine-protein kinase